MTATTFVTDAGVLIPAVSVEQMREVDRIAIDEVGSNLFQMMENAGRSLTHTVLETLGPSWSSHSDHRPGRNGRKWWGRDLCRPPSRQPGCACDRGRIGSDSVDWSVRTATWHPPGNQFHDCDR